MVLTYYYRFCILLNIYVLLSVVQISLNINVAKVLSGLGQLLGQSLVRL